MSHETTVNSSLRTVEWKNNKVVMIDQTKLPNQLVFVEYDDFNQVADALRTLIVRGAAVTVQSPGNPLQRYVTG